MSKVLKLSRSNSRARPCLMELCQQVDAKRAGVVSTTEESTARMRTRHAKDTRHHRAIINDMKGKISPFAVQILLLEAAKGAAWVAEPVVAPAAAGAAPVGAGGDGAEDEATAEPVQAAFKVRRCWLIVSKPVLKPLMISALKTTLSFTAVNCCFQMSLRLYFKVGTAKQIAAGHYVLATTRTCSARCPISSGLACAHQLCVYQATNTHQLDLCVVNPFWMVRVGGEEVHGGASGGSAGAAGAGGAGGAGGEAARGARQTLAEAGMVGADAASDDDVVMVDPLVVSKARAYTRSLFSST